MLSTTSCRANVNCREKMPTAMDEEERKLQRLKAAVHYTVGRLCQSIGEDHQKEFSRQVIAAIAETTFRQCALLKHPQIITDPPSFTVGARPGEAYKPVSRTHCDIWWRIDIFAKDLEAFARHAKRSTVSVEDVKLTARRSTALSNFIQRKSEEIASTNQEQRDTRKKIAGKRKNTEMV